MQQPPLQNTQANLPDNCTMAVITLTFKATPYVQKLAAFICALYFDETGQVHKFLLLLIAKQVYQSISCCLNHANIQSLHNLKAFAQCFCYYSNQH